MLLSTTHVMNVLTQFTADSEQRTVAFTELIDISYTLVRLHVAELVRI